MSDTLITRMAALLRHAEKAATPEESAAYQEKAQALATRHAIDLELARNHKDSQERKPQLTNTSLRIGERGKRGLQTYIALFGAIAHANNVKYGFSSDSTTVYPYGFDTDIEVTIALFEWLLPQMIKESDAYIRQGDYKNEIVYREVRVKTGYDNWFTGRPEYETEYRKAPVHGRTARISFQEAFANTIRARLSHARKEAEAAAKAQEQTTLNTTPDSPEDAATAVSDSVALVLVQREVAVRDYFTEASKGWRKRSTIGSSSYSSHANGAGSKAGARASLAPARAIGGHRTQVSA
jgi:hypothetical protein